MDENKSKLISRVRAFCIGLLQDRSLDSSLNLSDGDRDVDVDRPPADNVLQRLLVTGRDSRPTSIDSLNYMGEQMQGQSEKIFRRSEMPG